MFEVDHINGLNFLLERCVSVLEDFITKMEVGNFFISRSQICSQTYLPSK